MKIEIYALVTALVLTPAPAAAAPPSEWPQVGYGPGSAYYNPDESRLNAATAARRTIVAAATGTIIRAGSPLPLEPPVIADGRMLLTDGDDLRAYY
jgi:hypothetical protein